MKNNINTIIGYIVWWLIVSISWINRVAAEINVTPPSGNVVLPSINSNGGPWDAIGSIIGWMIGLTAVLTVLAITWAGIQMILATGEEEKFKKARHTMIYAFIGLLVAGLAYGAVTLITNLQLNNFL